MTLKPRLLVASWVELLQVAFTIERKQREKDSPVEVDGAPFGELLRGFFKFAFKVESISSSNFEVTELPTKRNASENNGNAGVMKSRTIKT
jgi:hypothetical protein